MINEIHSLNDMFDYIKEPYYTTVMFDIDDTLITTANHSTFCPNRNFRERLKAGNFRYRSDGRFASYCDEKYIDIVRQYNNEIKQAKWVYTEPQVPHVLRQLNKSGIQYIYFTARGMEISRETKAILKKLKILPIHMKHRVRNFPNVTGRSGLRDSIIYAGGYDKCQLLRDCGYLVQRNYIMVDDSLSNLQSFEDYFNASKLEGFNFIGLHYKRLPEVKLSYESIYPFGFQQLYQENQEKVIELMNELIKAGAMK